MPQDEGVNIRFMGQAGPLQGAIKQVVASLSSFTGGLTVAAGAAAFLAFKGIQPLIAEAEKFEKQTAELAKLVGTDIAGPMAESIAELGNELPVARAQLFDVAETAARLGIRGQKNITQFTQTMAKMGVATDISATVAADAMARIAKQAQLPIAQLENLGASINELSNTMATSSSEIVSNMRRSVPQLARLGVPVEDIAAMGAALNEVSESATRAGTRLRRLGQAMANPKKMGGFAEALGVTVDEFEAMMEENPTDTILEIIDVFREGEEGARILATTMDSRVRQVLAALAQNFEGLERAMGSSREQFEEVTSLNEEFARFADIAVSKSQILQNRLDDMQRRAGESFLQMKVAMTELATKWLETVQTITSNPLRFSIEDDPEVADELLSTIEESIYRADRGPLNRAVFSLIEGIGGPITGPKAKRLGRNVSDLLVRGIGHTIGSEELQEFGLEQVQAKAAGEAIRALREGVARNAPEAAAIFSAAATKFIKAGGDMDKSSDEWFQSFDQIQAALFEAVPALQEGGEVSQQVASDISNFMHVLDGTEEGIERFRAAIAETAPHWEAMAEGQDDASDSTEEIAKMSNLYLDILDPLTSGVIELGSALSDQPSIIENNKGRIEELVQQYAELKSEQQQLGEDEELGALSESQLNRVSRALEQLVGGEAFELLRETLEAEGITPGQRLQLFEKGSEFEKQLTALIIRNKEYQESQENRQRIDELAGETMARLSFETDILVQKKEQLNRKLEAARQGIDEEVDAYTEAEEQMRRYELQQEGIVGSTQDEIIERERRNAQIGQDIDTLKDEIRVQERLQKKIDKLTFATIEARFDLLTNTISRVSDAFMDFVENVVTGSESAADALINMIQSVVSEMARSQLEAFLLKFASGAIRGGVSGGGSMSSDIPGIGDIDAASPLAKGGRLPAGQLGIVGEEGPEFFVPEVNGIVTPRLHRAGGGRGGPREVRNDVTFNVQAMDAAGVEQMLQTRGRRAIMKVMRDAMKNSSNYRRGLLAGR